MSLINRNLEAALEEYDVCSWWDTKSVPIIDPSTQRGPIGQLIPCRDIPHVSKEFSIRIYSKTSRNCLVAIVLDALDPTKDRSILENDYKSVSEILENYDFLIDYAKDSVKQDSSSEDPCIVGIVKGLKIFLERYNN